MSMTYYSWEITLQCCKKLNLGFRKSNEILDENAKKKVQSCMQLDVLDLMLPLSKIRVKPEAELKVSCYADASFQLDENDTKSQTGYVINGICLDNNYLDGLECLMPSNKRPMEMLCDNEPAIAIANDPGILKGARHFQRKYHYIREVFKNVRLSKRKITQMTT
ncbi:hypothetical protein Tco_0038120 [Tanacetum coccineum]